MPLSVSGRNEPGKGSGGGESDTICCAGDDGDSAVVEGIVVVDVAVDRRLEWCLGSRDTAEWRDTASTFGEDHVECSGSEGGCVEDEWGGIAAT
jgi:hypothetical protein